MTLSLPRWAMPRIIWCMSAMTARSTSSFSMGTSMSTPSMENLNFPGNILWRNFSNASTLMSVSSIPVSSTGFTGGR